MAFNPLLSYQAFVDLDGRIYALQGGIIYDRFGNVLPNMPRPINGYSPLTFVPGGWAKIVTKTANYNATVDDNTILVNALSNPVTIALPTASQAFVNGVGQIISVKKIDASGNLVTLTAASIDGAASLQLSNPNSTARVQSNGVAWFVLAQT